MSFNKGGLAGSWFGRPLSRRWTALSIVLGLAMALPVIAAQSSDPDPGTAPAAPASHGGQPLGVGGGVDAGFDGLSITDMLSSMARGEDVRHELAALKSRAGSAGSKASAADAPRHESTAMDQLVSSLGRLESLGQLESLGRLQKTTGEVEARRLAAEDLLAADMLVRGRFDSIADTLEQQELPGSERLQEVRLAYSERLDPVIRWAEVLLDAAASAKGKPETGTATPSLDSQLLNTALEDLTDSVGNRVLRGALLPYRGAAPAPRPLITGPAIQPVYLDAGDPGSTAEDLRGTASAPISPTVQAKAEELGYDYVEIYQWVRNSVGLELYDGSLQGAEGTLRSGHGNSVDQASLLVALYRASGVAARFVHGVIEVEVDQLAADLGLSTGSQVPEALSRAGIAHEPVIQGGTVAAVRLQHTWVAAHVPYTNYRGAVVDFTGRTWLPLDPSWTRFEVQPAGPALDEMGFDAETFRSQWLSARQQGLPLERLRSQVESHLFKQGVAEPNWQDAVGSRRPVIEELGILPSSLPYKVVSVVGQWAELPTDGTGPALAQGRVVVRSGESEGSAILLDHSLPLRELSGRRVTLSYEPATVDDHRLVLGFGGLDSVPAYLVRLRPVLKVAGRTVKLGEPMDMGIRHRVELQLSGGWGTEIASQTAISGSYLAIAVGGPRLQSTVDPEDPADTESLAARVLWQLGARYTAAWDAGEDEAARWLDVTVVRPAPSVTFAGHRVRVSTLAGLPSDLDFEGIEIDAALRIAVPSGEQASDWRRLSGLQGSALEQWVLSEYLLVESISADKGLGLARDLGVDVRTLQAGADLGSLNLDSAVLDEIAASLAAGQVVEVPVEELQLNDWQGSVWRVEDPASGAQGYFLSGGLAGGLTTVNPSDWNPEIADEVSSPYAEAPNKDPFAAAVVDPIWAWNGQMGTVGKIFDRPLGVTVYDRAGRPVQGATVTFQIETGFGRLRTTDGDQTGSRVSTKTNGRGRALVELESGTLTSDHPVFLRRNNSETHRSRVLLNQLRAWVVVDGPDLNLSRPLYGFGFPDQAVSLTRTDEVPAGNEFIDSTKATWTDTMEFYAEDQYGNPVANVGTTVFDKGYWAGYVGIETQEGPVNCSVPQEPAKLTFFDARLGSNGKPDDCSSTHPKIGECGKTFRVVETRWDGKAAVGVIGGDSWVQNQAGVRQSKEEDKACDGRLSSGDFLADAESTCGDLYDDVESLQTTESTYYYSYLVLVPADWRADLIEVFQPCWDWVVDRVVVEGAADYAAARIGESLRDPVTISRYELKRSRCESTGPPVCTDILFDLETGEPAPNCGCDGGNGPEPEACGVCEAVWNACKGDSSNPFMPAESCLQYSFTHPSNWHMETTGGSDDNGGDGSGGGGGGFGSGGGGGDGEGGFGNGGDGEGDSLGDAGADPDGTDETDGSFLIRLYDRSNPRYNINQAIKLATCSWRENLVCAKGAREWKPFFLVAEDSRVGLDPDSSLPGYAVSSPLSSDPGLEIQLTAGPSPGMVSIDGESLPGWKWSIAVDPNGILREGDTRYTAVPGIYDGRGSTVFRPRNSPSSQTVRGLMEFWGIDPQIASVQPNRISLDEEKRTTHPIEVTYSITPSDYRPSSVAVALSEEVDNTLFWAVGQGINGDPTIGKAVFPRGLRLDPTKAHEVQLVVNPGTRFEVRPAGTVGTPGGSGESGRVSLPLQDPSQGKVIRTISRSVTVTQSVDLAQQRSCSEPGVFVFQLVRDADVSFRARRINGNNADGSPRVGESFELIEPRFLQAEAPTPEGGAIFLDHVVDLTVDDLPAGDYIIEVRAEASQNEVETREVRAFSRSSVSNSLPLGHTLIQGVDLWNGALSLSRADFDIPGRGPELQWRRTYSSSNGADHGVLGIGWGHNYESTVFRSSCDTLTISGGEGSGMQFDVSNASDDGDTELLPLNGYHGSLIYRGSQSAMDYYTPGGRRYHYLPGQEPSTWRLSLIEDPNGNTLTLSYADTPEGAVLEEVSDTEGRKLRFTIELRQFLAWRGAVITVAEGPGGLRMDYEYDDYGHLIRATREGEVKGEAYSYQPQPDWNYEVRHVLHQVEDVVTGALTDYTWQVAPITGFDATKPSLMVTELLTPESRDQAMLFDYDEAALLSRGGSATTQVTDRRGQTTTYEFNDYGSATSIIDPLGHRTEMEWNLERAKVSKRTDALGRVTDYVYDEHGNVLTETVGVYSPQGDPVSSAGGPWTVTTTYYPPSAFDPPYLKNRVHTRTNRAGDVSTFTYDSRGNLLSETVELDTADGRNARSITVGHTYDSRGDRISTTDGRGHTSTYRYDELGYPLEMRNALGELTQTVYDERGRLVAQTDAEGRVTTQSWDTQDRLVGRHVAELAEETTIYDDAARTRTSIDAEGRRTTTEFDLEGRVVNITNAEQGRKDFQYDGEGLKTEESLWFDETTPRQSITYTYDAAGRLDLRIEPLGRVTDHDHDAVSNLVQERLYDSGDPQFQAQIRRMEDFDALNRSRREVKVLVDPLTGAQSEAVMLRTYDGEGRMLREVDAEGRESTWTYDGAGREIASTVGDGLRQIRKFYDDAGNLERTVLLNSGQIPFLETPDLTTYLEPSGDQVRESAYDAANRQVSQTDAEGQITFLEYDQVGNLVRTTDPRGTVVVNEYNDLNQLVKTRELLERGRDEAEWAETFYVNDLVGNRLSETWPNGNEVIHTYDGLNRRKSTTDSIGQVGLWRYDARGNVTSQFDGEGKETVTVYDALNRATSQTLPGDRATERTYDVAGNVLSETDPLDHTAQHLYDTFNRRVRSIAPQPFLYEATTAYDLVGNAIQTTDARGLITDFEFDALNRLTRRLDPELPGAVRLEQVYAYDGADNRLAHRDARGLSTLSAYDKENRPMEVQRAGLILESTEYDPIGNPRFVTDANGNITGFIYNERSRVLEENRPESSVTLHSYDLQGNRVSTLDGEGREVRFTYDERNRLLTDEREVEPSRFAATAFTYDLNNLRLTVTRPESGVQTLTYDAANRLETVTQTQNAAGQSAVEGTTTYGYDANDNLITVDDAEGRRTELRYDELNRRTEKIYPTITTGSFSESWTYDENGNVLTFTDAKGQVFTSTWDALNRETSRSYPAQNVAELSDYLESTAMDYDENNNLVEVRELFNSSGLKTTGLTYDSFDRAETITDRWGRKITYTYDANGNRTGLQAPGQVTSYAYDGLNRLERVTHGSGQTRYDYFNNSRLKKVTYPNGTTAAYSFDQANRLSRIEHHQGSLLISSYGYAYDDNGNRVEQTEYQINRGTEVTTYGYDLADRLQQVTYPDQDVVYGYDRVGNRQSETITVGSDSPFTKTYGYNHRDQLLSILHSADPTENVAYGYDANGNQISKTKNGVATTYTVTSRNQIARVEENGLPVGTYRYDYRGLRISKYTDRETQYLYDDQSVLQRHDANEGTIYYDYGPDRLLSVSHPAEGRQYYLHDALGSVVGLTTQGGSLQAQYSYDAWGNYRHRQEGLANVFGFTGHETDAESGLIYAKARFYDPDSGRFLSHDPVEGDPNTPPSLHRFLYAYQNPTVYVDPTGEIPLLALVLVGAEIGFFTDLTIQQIESDASEFGDFLERDFDGTRSALNTAAGGASGGIGGKIAMAGLSVAKAVGSALAADTLLDTGVDYALSEEGEFSLGRSLATNAAGNALFGGLVAGGGKLLGGVKGSLGGAFEKVSNFFGRGKQSRAEIVGEGARELKPVSERAVQASGRSADDLLAEGRAANIADVLARERISGTVSGGGGIGFRLRTGIRAGSSDGGASGSRAPRETVQQFTTPYSPLGATQRRALRAKAKDRTITRDEYQHLQWDRRFSNRRSRGVSRFWAQERRSLRSGQSGTRNWTPEQREAILSGKVPQFGGKPIEGHHRYNALDHPQLADDGSIIYPATNDEHLYRWHGGSWQNDTSGAPLNPGFKEQF